MNALFGIEVLGLDKTAKVLADLPAKLERAETRAVNRLVIRAERSFRRRVSGDVLKVRTGAYRASISRQLAEKHPVSGIQGTVGVAKGPASPYARIHETGGTIRAKGTLLAIPLPSLLTKAGVARSKSPRDFPDGFWFTSKAGNAIFAIREGEKLTPLFVGKPSVVIPQRRPLGQTLDEIKPLMRETFEEEVRRAVGA